MFLYHFAVFLLSILYVQPPIHGPHGLVRTAKKLDFRHIAPTYGTVGGGVYYFFRFLAEILKKHIWKKLLKSEGRLLSSEN